MILVYGSTSVAQKIALQNNGDLIFTGGLIKTRGPANYNNGAALIANMKSGVVAEGRYCQRLYGGFYLGASISYTTFSKWQDGTDITFTGTGMTVASAAPVIQFKTTPAMIDRHGKFSVFVALAPGVYRIITSTNENSQINLPPYKNNLVVKSNRFGYDASAGVNYVCSASFGLTLSAGYNSITTDSHVYQEKKFNYMVIRAGFFYRMSKRQNFKY